MNDNYDYIHQASSDRIADMLEEIAIGAEKGWSEEDEQCLQKAIECTFGNGYLSVSSWLKSFKDRVSQPHWKPSEKEIITLSSLLDFDYSMEHRETYRTIDNLYNELKILRDYD